MNAIEALKKGFELAKQLVLLIAVVAVFNCITSGIVVGIVGINPTPEKVGEIAGTIVFLSMLIMLAWIVVEGGLLASIVSYIKTKDMQLEALLNNGLKYFLRLLGIGMVGGAIAVAIWIAGALLTAIFVAMGQGTNPFFNVIGGIVFTIAVLFSFVVMIPIIIGRYLIVVEDQKIIASFKEGVALFKQYWGRILALLGLIIGIVLVVSLLSQLISLFLAKIFPQGWFLAILQVLISAIVNGMIGVFSSCSIVSLILSIVKAPEVEAPIAVPEQPTL
ncbi:MAG: hypothetical protein GY853_14830 [PVC group bacterium]|nr:hypothetical protein [PVC group bacterium]